MSKLLSIIVPTFNRSDILKYTLSHLIPQVEKKEDIEVYLCNNASTDSTKEVLQEYQNKYAFVNVINYEEHLDIGNSIARSISNATGKYFLLWSDDDIPAPYMVNMFLDAIRNNPDVACVVGNRLVGKSQKEGYGITNLSVHDGEYNGELLFESSDLFVRKFAGAMGFLSVDLIRRDLWEKNSYLSSNDCWGYEFLLPMLAGLKGENCVYLSYPTCIQRRFVNPRYLENWVKFAYVGMPRLLRKLEELGVITDWSDGFRQFKYNQSDVDFIQAIKGVCWKNKTIYSPLVGELYGYQESRIRRFFIKSINKPSALHSFYNSVYFIYRIFFFFRRKVKRLFK